MPLVLAAPRVYTGAHPPAMIPLRDLAPTRITPVVTITIVAVNALVFALTFGDLEQAVWSYGAIAFHFTGLEPEALVVADEFGRRVRIAPPPASEWSWLRAFTHMWMHGGILHVLGNLWFLWVFGDNVEERLGRARYVAVYLGAGFVALAAQVVSAPAAAVPMVGASGAVSGVLGAYLRFFPRARIVTLVPIGFLLLHQLWPASVFLGVWIGLQVLHAALDPGAGGGVAWWAHIGGFALGWLVAPLLVPPAPRVLVDWSGDDRWR